MNKELNILCVEDVPADVARLNHELRQGGISFNSKRVVTQEAFLHELEHNPPDVILSDHGLPSFDGFMALTIAQEKCPEVPFIFVTGKPGEQIAIETLRNGATDYVLKSNLTKLVPTVQRALREAEARVALKQEALQLRENEQFYRQLVEFCPDAFLVHCQGKIVFANRAAARLLGAGEARQLVGKPVGEVIHPESGPSLETRFNELIQTGTIFFWRKIEKENGGKQDGPANDIVFTGEKFIRLDGSTVEVEVAATPLTLQGRPAIQMILRALTPRREAEQALLRSEALKTAILNTSLDAIISIDHTGLIHEWNPAAERIFGYDRAQVLGKRVDDLMVSKSLLEISNVGWVNHFFRDAGSLLGRTVELTLRRSDGSEIRVEMAISRTPTEDPPRCTVFVRDITGRAPAGECLRQGEECR